MYCLGTFTQVSSEIALYIYVACFISSSKQVAWETISEVIFTAGVTTGEHKQLDALQALEWAGQGSDMVPTSGGTWETWRCGSKGNI